VAYYKLTHKHIDMGNILNPLKRLLLSAQTRKFIKAGILNEDLVLTGERGVRAVQRIVFEKFSTEMEAIADELIEADKEEKGC
jgi:hypothetical protein